MRGQSVCFFLGKQFEEFVEFLGQFNGWVGTMFGLNFFFTSFKETENSFIFSCVYTWKNGAVAIILISSGVSDGGKKLFVGTVVS